MSKASGDYIAFLDADDILHPQCYEILLTEAENTKADVVACAFDTFIDGENFKMDSYVFEYEVCLFSGGQQAAQSMVSSDKGNSVRGLVWNKVYKKILFDRVRFDESLIICEDSVFSWEIMKLVGTIALVKTPLYHYRKRKDGSTGSANFDKNFTAVEAYSRMIKDITTGAIKFERIYRDELLKQYVYWILRAASSPERNNNKLENLQDYIKLIPASYDVDGLETSQKINALRKSAIAYLRLERRWNAINKGKKTIKRLIQR